MSEHQSKNAWEAAKAVAMDSMAGVVAFFALAAAAIVIEFGNWGAVRLGMIEKDSFLDLLFTFAGYALATLDVVVLLGVVVIMGGRLWTSLLK